MLAATLSKNNLIFEDKVIIQNCLEIIVGILLFRRSIYQRFIAFASEGQVKNTEDLILAGLLSSEEKVRVDFLSSLRVIAVNVDDGENSALNFNLGVLARNFAIISNKPSRQFFELFNVLIDLKAMRDNILGEGVADSA